MKRPDWPVAVIGAGTMGHGIAQVAAKQGFEVRLHDLSSEALDKGMSGIELTLDKALARGVVTPTQKKRHCFGFSPSTSSRRRSTGVAS